MAKQYGPAGTPQGLTPEEQVARDLHQNRYDPGSDTLAFTNGQAKAFDGLVAFYTGRFNSPKGADIVPPAYIGDPMELHQLTSYFAWSAWVSTADRPGSGYSYTANWPPEILAGNLPTADSVVWSVLSIIALLGGTGLVLFFFGRYDWLGWRGAELDGRRVRFYPPGDVVLTPGQRATAWFFLVVALLFLAQALNGGLIAHYRADPTGSFYGLDFTPYLPYNLSRTWHVQLAIFWVAAAYLGAGIFIAPLIAGREPRGQKLLAYLLLGAVVVVVGSLLGEAGSIHNLLGGGFLFPCLEHRSGVDGAGEPLPRRDDPDLRLRPERILARQEPGLRHEPGSQHSGMGTPTGRHRPHPGGAAPGVPGLPGRGTPETHGREGGASRNSPLHRGHGLRTPTKTDVGVLRVSVILNAITSRGPC